MDYDYQTTAPVAIEHLARLKSEVSKLFRSRTGRVEIYDLAGWLEGPNPRNGERSAVSTPAISPVR